MVKNTVQARRVAAYPSPLYHQLLKGYVKVEEMPISEAVSEMIKEHFDAMPACDREKYLLASKK
jgi:hypothetical protein